MFPGAPWLVRWPGGVAVAFCFQSLVDWSSLLAVCVSSFF